MGIEYTRVVLTLAVVAAGIVGGAIAVSDKDREECAEQLVGLATCLPYVGGDAKSPTPDCCNGLKQVLNKDKKCLCVIVVDRNDPQLGLKINVTLALSLPSVCHASANVSQCPELLHLPANSPDAQIFYQFSKKSNQSATSAALSPTVEEKPGSGESAQKISSGRGTSGKAWFKKLEIFVSLGFLFLTIV